jgi:hypothetical protein
LFAEGFHAIVAAKRDGDVRFLEVNIGFGNEWIGDKGGIEEALWRLKEEIVGPASAEELWLKERRLKVLSRNPFVKRGLWEHEFLPVIDKNSGVQLSNDNGGFKLRQGERIDPKLINGDVNMIDSHDGVELPITEQRAGMRDPSQRVGTLESEAMDLDTGGITSPSPQQLLNGLPLIILSDSEHEEPDEDDDEDDDEEEAAPPWAFSNLRPLGAELKQKLLEERIAEMGFAGSNGESLYA